ncbi:MAG: hypothetical protein ACRC8P_01510 [Spiroplasma sp.]
MTDNIYIKDELLDKYHDCDNYYNNYCECSDENIDIDIINNIKKEAINEYKEKIDKYIQEMIEDSISFTEIDNLNLLK